MTSLTKNPHLPSKTFFSSASYKTYHIFSAFDWVDSANQTGEIPVQSHVHFGVFFLEIPKSDRTQGLNYVTHLKRAEMKL